MHAASSSSRPRVAQLVVRAGFFKGDSGKEVNDGRCCTVLALFGAAQPECASL